MGNVLLRGWTRIAGGLDSRSFVRLVQTHVLSSAGDAFVAVALAGSVFFSEDPTTARSRVALSLLLTMAPFAIVAPFLGPVIDRVRGGRRLVLFTAAAARALLCLLMAGALDQLWLYPIAFLSLVFSKTHAVAKSASVPEIVESDAALVRANAALALTAVLSGFVAGGVGYGVSKLGGEAWVLRAGALVFAAAAALAFEVGTTNQRPGTGLVDRAASQLRDTGVVLAGAVMATYRMAVGFLTFLIAFDFRRAGAPTWWFALPISASMIGSSLGNLLAPRLRGHVREEWILIGAGASVSVAAGVLASHPDRWSSSLLAMVLGFAAGAAKLAFDSLVQRDAPAAVQGQSFARFEAVFQLVWVLGALVPVILVIGPGLGCWILSLSCGAAAGWYTLRRHGRSHPG